MGATVTVHVDAPPEKLYDMVSDVTRMGEWSPECYRCEWLDGAAGPAVGARFKGRNKYGLIRWSSTPRVVVAEPGREFTFEHDYTRWTYRFEPANGGTDVTESFEDVKPEPFYIRIGQLFMPGRSQEEGMRQTLARIKAAAEKPS